MKEITKELRRICQALKYSRDGMRAAWRDAGAFRTEAILTPFIVFSAFYFAPDNVDLALMLGSWLLILVVELLNTGIEAVTDLAAHGKIHPDAKKAKDAGSAAVLIACVICVSTWMCILL